ncbi:hypothetical protein GH714_013313 [Hevea brasiliensis]|uniref:HAT C-terminal dimerisation domain-containing protein n=1 Tax=Hevea brasiliensis TaxID=3981 RepID=A0A6A6KBS4_HEVBR|nr:hypothetical protein GH714_013313 [Hevea brasiliensis]
MNSFSSLAQSFALAKGSSHIRGHVEDVDPLDVERAVKVLEGLEGVSEPIVPLSTVCGMEASAPTKSAILSLTCMEGWFLNLPDHYYAPYMEMAVMLLWGIWRASLPTPSLQLTHQMFLGCPFQNSLFSVLLQRNRLFFELHAAKDDGFQYVIVEDELRLIEGCWQLMFTTRPGTASPIQRTFVGVDFFSVFQDVYLRTNDPRVSNIVRFSDAIEGEGRVPPHMDGEVSTERIKCFRRIFSNEDERIRANDEFANFSLKSGPFADPDSIGSMYVTDPRKWWACFGSNAPLLQRLAFKVLGQPTSSSCCERNWSIYSFIHSCRRNKLTPKRAEDLVFIHNNLRLLSRNSSQYYDEKTKLWDVGGDQFGSMEDVGVLEFANLSLDEPELESVLFDENATTSMEKENEKDSEVEEML